MYFTVLKFRRRSDSKKSGVWSRLQDSSQGYEEDWSKSTKSAIKLCSNVTQLNNLGQTHTENALMYESQICSL